MPPAKASNTAEADSAEGLLLVDKPAGITSHDAVQAVRRACNQRSVGHLGTLDPFATGLLVMLLGRSTRLAQFIAADPKVYDTTISFGRETNTDDLTGETIRSAAPPDEALLRTAIAQLTGDLEQVPPAFSAKQVDGQRAYISARKGEDLDLKPVSVTVHKWEVHSYSDGLLRATITCTAGTYIRSLARDLGRLTGSAAHLEELRRTRSGEFAVSNALTIQQLQESPPVPMKLRIVAEPVI